jgi:hypothetical protein
LEIWGIEREGLSKKKKRYEIKTFSRHARVFNAD